MEGADQNHEQLVEALYDDAVLEEYRRPLDSYRVSFVPHVLGGLMVWCGNAVYGHLPSYMKFRAIEVIARVPYNSCASAIFTLLTMFYGDEKRALRLSTISQFARFAMDNETMHVVVISALARKEDCGGFIRRTLMPMIFAFLYFWISYLMYLLRPRWSLELNYVFEKHAFEQYSLFLTTHERELKTKMVESEFLAWYGRHPRSQYEFFRSVRNDELIHRNRSVHEIEMNVHRMKAA
ncbi:MAG TPA: alternative oxidase [Candidatus Paceibacterota bacterium]|nr:alternative oxidase [Candidatus Paceibacterota bacterium]